MKSTIVADYINSTEEGSRVRRKVAKAIKRFRQVKSQDLAHAEGDLKHAKDDLAAATSSFEHLVQDFVHAIDDFSESGRDPAHGREDHDHAQEDFDAAEEKLQHALKDFRHALKDFSQAWKDLEQIEEMAEQIAESANEAGNKEITAELVRIYVKEQASSDCSQGKTEKGLEGGGRLTDRSRAKEGGPGDDGGRHSLNREDPFVLQH
jgi:hypothetical protein